MSLDVYLVEKKDILYTCEICGHQHPCTDSVVVYSANITHNLNQMADKAGIYNAIWRPDRILAQIANDIILPLQNGISELKQNPDYFKKFNARNNWGTYDDFVPWVEAYLQACINNPNAYIQVNR